MSTAQEQSDPAISTVAGNDGPGGFKGENEPAATAQLNRPLGVAVDGTGTLFIADYNNQRVRKVTTDGRITTVAGTGVAGFAGNNGPADKAQLSQPRGLAVDGAGNLYIADAGNHRLRKITADGRITTIAGTGTGGFVGNNGPAVSAQLNYPLAVAVDSAGVLYISDFSGHRIRKITADGRISTVAGTGTAGSGGDGGPADKAQLNGPRGLALDGAGNLYIADAGNNRIRKITADGRMSTVAGTGTAGFSGDGGPADKAQLSAPLGVVVNSAGEVLLSDYNNHRVRRIAGDGTITTVAGTKGAGFSGDGGPASAAQLSNPTALAVDCVDTLYIADHVNNRVRRIASPMLTGLPESGTVASWANVRSNLRMGVLRESYHDGAEIHQSPVAPREHQRWRLLVVGQESGDVLYTLENVRSGKVLEVAGAEDAAGALIAQRTYQGADAHHQQWRLIPVGSPADSPRVYEIANRNSGLLLRADAPAPAAIRQRTADGDHRLRQWQLLPA
ncbi:RICIN domain-containing protein [Kitasatospora sp. NPDC092948]|uniref:NHL domain-containing protein n=1 Tax=Kitasatospora sp. NPDC092948 TaxID=3364088 RepID=UPI00381ED9B9